MHEPGLFLSVVIPTRNRAAVLARTLRAYAEQTAPPGTFELVVVDDGSEDGTWEQLNEFAGSTAFSLRPRQQPFAGPGPARNAGIEHARGEIIVFAGDDIVPTAGFIERHVEAHNAEPADTVAILGHTDWDPSIAVTPIMHYLTETTSIQFGYSRIRDPENVPPACFYTSNLSLKRRFLEQDRFRADLFYPLEDVELGQRLSVRDMTLKYRPAALAHHQHPITRAECCARQVRIGRAARILEMDPAGVQEVTGLAEPTELGAMPGIDDLHDRARRYEQFLDHGQLTQWETVACDEVPADTLRELYAVYRPLLLTYYALGLAGG